MKTEGNTLQSLDRALELLDILANKRLPQSAADLSNELHINRTTVYAMLNSLLKKQYIEKDETTSRYTIGYKLFELGQMYRYKFPFYNLAEKQAVILKDKWKLNVYVSVYKECGSALMLLVQLPSGTPMLSAGWSTPLHATGMGKVLLSGFTDEQLEEELQGMTFTSYTSSTITDPAVLRAVIQDVKKQGYAFDNCEYLDNTFCIASPLRDIAGHVVAAMSISGPKELVAENREDILRDIQAATRLISMDLGWRP